LRSRRSTIISNVAHIWDKQQLSQDFLFICCFSFTGGAIYPRLRLTSTAGGGGGEKWPRDSLGIAQ
jgi:hypothetical protein